MSQLPRRVFLDRSTGPHTATLIVLASISALASNIFLPSLPSMADHFGTTAAVMGLSVGVFLAASAVVQVIAGPVSDAIGRRPVIMAGLAIFLVSTVASIFAPNVTVFLVLRACQAAGATAMVLSRAIVRDMVPAERAGSMIAYVTMGMAVIPMLSPVLGGYIDLWFGWQANFWLLAASGLGVILLAHFDQGETAPLSGGGLRAQAANYPELLTSYRFWGYCMASALGSGAFFAYLGGAPFVGDQVFHLSPQQLGLGFGAPSVGYFFGNFLTGRYSTRIGINRMVLWGLMITVSGVAVSLVLSYAGVNGPLTFFGLICFVGLGNGMTIPNATAGMLSVRPHLAGSASGLGSAIMIGGGAVLSSLAGVLLRPGTGEFPLLWIMGLSSGAGILCILFVIRRERQLGL
ncbi:Bcr/CflA family efflux MFS transporter [Aquicoccus sp. SCR17]|nr:Bcr/CflA family efflux MFS transporter [Carideicomes alvinocaridis]